ncbi:hypothetical protein BDR26DRAFT_1012478 [Obelidium mucronatum]|nr:hypothetical protein BDR26DRAFT_1012478 [Obelidium mucronatum]
MPEVSILTAAFSLSPVCSCLVNEQLIFVWQNQSLHQKLKELGAQNLNTLDDKKERDVWLRNLKQATSVPTSTRISHYTSGDSKWVIEWTGTATKCANGAYIYLLHLMFSKIEATYDIPFDSSTGVMGDIVKSFDWLKTAPELGEIRNWPSSLKTATSLVLRSKIQGLLLWGPAYRVIAYNDISISTFGGKHPTMLGASYAETFQEIWHIIKGTIVKAKETGQTSYFEDKGYMLFRHGFMELTYFTVTTCPVLGDRGEFEGVITWSFETTAKVVGNNRIMCLQDLGLNLISSPNVTGYWEALWEVLQNRKEEFAFGIIYRRENDGILLRYDKVVNIESSFPNKIDPVLGTQCDELTSKIAEAWNLEDTIEIIPAEAHPVHKNGTILIIPILTTSDDAPGLLVLGTNPNLNYDERYRSFINMAVHEIATSYTSVKSLETAKKQNHALLELDKVKTSFFVSMSHELRTPLTLIISPVEDVIKESKNQLTKEQSSTLELVRKNACRLLKLVNTLLDIGRLNAGCMTATFRRTNIADKIHQFESMFEGIIKKAGLNFITEFSQINEPCYMDEEMLQKIVFNLLGNAIKFTLKGYIKTALRLSDDNKKFEFVVEDSGVGIPKDQLGRVFQQFHRVDYAGGRSFEGSGIGLALVSDLVKLHGGTITLRSVFGVGSTFIVSIPVGKNHLPPERVVETSLQDIDGSPVTSDSNTGHLSVFLEEAREFAESCPQTNETTSSAQEELETHLETDAFMIPKPDPNDQDSDIFNKRLIFLVDDNSDMRKYLSQIISRYWSCQTFDNGHTALNAMKRIAPSLVVSDVLMPVLDGLQLVKEMRRRSDLAAIPVILFSGTGNKIDGFESGADDFLEKPINQREMIFKIQKLLERSAIQTHLENDIKKEKEYSAHAMKRYEQMSRISPLGLFLCDEQGNLLFANDKFAQMFGFEGIDSLMSANEGSMNSVLPDGIHPDDKEETLENWRKCINNQEPVVNLEFRIRPSAAGKISWVQLCTILDSEADGSLIHIGCMSDITIRKLLEEERIQAFQFEQETQKKRADDAIQSKIDSEKFIDMVCHELRNPLNGIQNSNMLLAELVGDLSGMLDKRRELNPSEIEEVATKAREYTDAIDICAKHQQTIADDVLNLSKLNMSLISISKSTPFNPKELLKKVLSTFKAEMITKKTKLTIQVDPQFSEQFGKSDFLGDPARITQIVINLVANASKFTMKSDKRDIRAMLSAEFTELKDSSLCEREIREGSTDDVSNVLGRANLKIAVRDTGIGMTEEEKARLFKQFQQASNRTYAEYGGSGLGLFISKRLVDMMGGQVSVESTKGVGTTFTVIIPLRYTCPKTVEKSVDTVAENVNENRSRQNSNYVELTPSPMVPRSSQRRQSGLSKLNGEKVLVVDDNDINRMVLQKHLTKIGEGYISAVNGQEAYDVFMTRTDEICMILMDLEMPILNGRDTTKKIREYEAVQNICSGIPIIAVTGNARNEQVEEARSSGMNDVLLKPFTRERLEEIIVKYKRSSKSQMAESALPTSLREPSH